ncbi:uncharacterized protein LOC121382227 [Gigantopelta aegis]|uniref:uncharacterized protein LOC121382227 n=1 Tax=Gigantopelta aegis TaxID=1735272 RepID=UPI001B88C121|nr:uncharacterized protein LOC121382227 [Gigantopelta aegis]
MLLAYLVAKKRILVLVCLWLACLSVCLRLFRSQRVLLSMSQLPGVPVKPNPVQDELIDAVLTFPLLTDPHWNSHGYRHLTYQQREARMDEYIESLANTLAHPRIGSVHCLYDQEALVGYVRRTISSNKLKFHYHNETHLALSLFRFAFQSLHGHLVMVLQADTYPAHGFQYVVGATMRKKNLFYALTRHGKMEATCDMHGDFCDDREYVGSHDAYIFVPTGELSARHGDVLNKKTMSWGVDLVIAWVFDDMGYRVLNPCKVIFLYHLHCTWVRDVGRVRVNTFNTTGWFPPTTSLS